MSDGLSAQLQKNLIKVLGQLDCFKDDKSLQAVLMLDKRVSTWANSCPAGSSIAKRVSLVIAYFYEKKNRNGRNGLVLLLEVLKDHTSEEDANYAELDSLAEQVSDEWKKSQAASQPSAPRPVAAPLHIDFVNRDSEKNLVLNSTLMQAFWMIDAPAGYGKTAFVWELHKFYQGLGWVCVFCQLSKKNARNTLGVANLILEQLHAPAVTLPDADLGDEIAAKLLDQPVGGDPQVHAGQAEHKGIAIILDNAEVLDDKTFIGVSGLIGDINKSLITTGYYSRNNLTRFILSGRDLRRKRNDIIRKILAYKGLSLSPFKFEHVKETVRRYARHSKLPLPDTTIAQIAAKLMYVSGGHPGLIAEILGELTRSNFATARTWLNRDPDVEYRERSAAYNAIIENYAVDEPDLGPILDTLSVFRRFGPWLLKDLIKAGQIFTNVDEHDLVTRLTGTYLLHRENGCLEDSITQRLLNIRMRCTDKPKFHRLCTLGRDFYHSRLSYPKTIHPVQWAVEYLCLGLQCAYFVENQRGADLKAAFLGLVAECRRLLKTWEGQSLYVDFIQALRDDWELEFLTNYFLSKKDAYADEYAEILIQIED